MSTISKSHINEVKIHILHLCIFVFALIQISCAQDTLKNLPELSLPLSNKKLVIAHNMTHIIRYQGRTFEDGCNSNFYPLTNNSSSPIGGYTQVNVLSDKYLKDSTLDQAVEFEMRAAKRCGIDGFQFYYPLGTSSWDNIIKAYFRVATNKNIDFKFTFCFSHPSGGNEDSKINEYANRVNGIINTVGRDNSHWLRTPDGRLIVYMWYGEQLASVPSNLAGFPSQFYVARAYRKLANAVGEKFACIYSINENISNSNLNGYLDYFPGVWMWTQSYTFTNLDATVATQCSTRSRNYTASAFPDFYTSKILQPGTWNIMSVANAVSAGVNNIERKHMVMGLSQTFRKQLEFAVNRDVSIINIITWNDYPEGHHLAPEVNHNYGFSVLLQYYKSLWKGEPSPYADRDVAIAFYKKYTRSVTPSPYNIRSINLGNTTNVNYEDQVEVVTILSNSGELEVNGERVNVPSGINSQRFNSTPGSVNVSIFRNGVKTNGFEAPEWITDKPKRTDRLTYTFDTEFLNFHRDIFGNSPPVYSVEYNPSPSTVPVKLTKFSVINNGNKSANLRWQTANELNVASYNIQRSVGNASNFVTISNTIAKGGNDISTNYFSLDDIRDVSHTKIFYRLEILDKDGTISYSDIKSITISGTSVFNVSPNPTKGGVINIKGDGLKTIKITDMKGRVLIYRNVIANDSVSINVAHFSSGIYIVTGQDKKGNLLSQNVSVKN